MPSWTRKKYVALAKGFQGRGRNCMRITIPRVEKSLVYAYRDRKVKRREYRKQWIMSINAAVREHNINYSNFIHGLNNSNILLNRKILADLAINEPYSFKAVVDEIKIKPFIETKPAEQMGYIEALSKGYIVEGAVKERVENKLKLPYFGLRFENELSEEEKLKRWRE